MDLWAQLLVVWFHEVSADITHTQHSAGSAPGAEGPRGFTQHLGRLGWLRPGLYLQLRGHASYPVAQRSWERKTKFGGFLPFKPGAAAASLPPRSVGQSRSLGHPGFTGKEGGFLPSSACRPGSSLFKIAFGTTDPGNKDKAGLKPGLRHSEGCLGSGLSFLAYNQSLGVKALKPLSALTAAAPWSA